MPDDRPGLAQHPSTAFATAPTTAQDRNPVVIWLLQASFALGVRALYRIEVIVPPGYALSGGTLIVSNHQRDADVPILAPALCQRDGLRFRFAPPFFAAREDLLRPGGLARLAVNGSWPLPSLLGAIPLTWLFRIGCAMPIRRVREFTLREAAAALTKAGRGRARIADVLNARGLREVGEARGDRPLCLLCEERGVALDRCWGLRRLRREALAIVAPGFRSAVALQLRDLANLLDAGHCLYLSPEGRTSDDGRFGRVREAGWRIGRLAARRHPVLPVALSYDALAAGRARVVVRVGTPLHDLDAADARGFCAALRESILRLYVVNPSHLVARYLARGSTRFTTSELGAWMRVAVAAVDAAGFAPDRLLAGSSLEALAEERLRWLAAKGIVVRESGRWRNVWRRDSPPGWSKPAAVVRYLANSLADLSPELDRTLGR